MKKLISFSVMLFVLMLFFSNAHAQYSYNVSISTLTPATSSICDGSYPVSALVTNNDPVNPTNGVVQVQYILDGVLVSTVATSGPLAGSSSQLVGLGTFGNKPGKHFLTATVVYSGNTSSNISITSILTVQFNGTYTIGINPSNNFASLKNAVDTINTYGLCGATTINCISGHAETNSEIVLNTTTTSVVRTLTFNGNGAIITAATGISLTTDGIIKIAGTSYVTFNGVVLQENAANTTATTRMEWGIALCKRNGTSPLKGAQHVTICNCNISLNKANNNSVGIYMGNHLATNTSQLLPLIAADLNSYNKFYNNNISNVYSGISLNGYADVAPFTLLDKYNEVGVSGRNTITNFGGGTTPTLIAYGIYTYYQDYLKIHNDSIIGSTTYRMTGIGNYGKAAQSDIQNNIISVVATSNGTVLCGIYSDCGTTGHGTISIKSNIIKNCRNNTGTTIGQVILLYVLNRFDTVDISGNIIKDNRFTAINSSMYGIQCVLGGVGTLLFHDNLITRNRQLGNVGDIQAIYIQQDTILNTTKIYNNQISYDSVSASGGIMVGILYSVVAPNLPAFCYNNEISNCYSNNGITAIKLSNVNSYTYRNTIHDLTAISGIVWGISNRLAVEINDNVLYNIIGSSYIGIQTEYITSTNNINIYNNKLFNFSASSTTVENYGIKSYSSVNNQKFNIYNNDISDLRAPNLNLTTPGIFGIWVNTGNYSSNYSLFFNTIYLNATSSGSNFGTCGIYLNSTATYPTPIFLVKNNIVVNSSVANGSGKVAAIGFNLYNLTRYSTSSDNNCLSAGNPGPNNVLMYNYQTSTGYPTLSGYKTYVSPREQNTINENPPFVNIATTPYNLHLQNTIPTLCESGAVRITSPVLISTDKDGNLRWGETGYVGAGTAPDMGAYEGNYIRTINVNLGNDTSVCGGQPFALNAGYPGASYTWSTNEHTQIIYVNTDDTYTVTVTNGQYQVGVGSITVTFLPSLTVSVNIVRSSDSICAGTLVTYTATHINGGTSPFYQWKVNGMNSGTNSSTFTYVPSINDSITCVLTSSLSVCTSPNPATSNTLKMMVYPVLPVSVSISADENPSCIGDNVTITAIPTNGGTVPIYQWYLNGISTGTNSNTFSFTPTNSDQIYCTLTSGLSCISGNPASSNILTMSVNPNADPVVHLGTDTTICVGATLVLNAGNTGAAYYWSTGATTQSINVTTGNDYSVAVTNCPAHIASDTINVIFSTCTGLDKNMVSDNFSLYPNPANERITVETINLNADAVLSIFNVQGQCILRQQIDEQKEEIDISNLSKGIYIAKFFDGNNTAVTRFAKE